MHELVETHLTNLRANELQIAWKSILGSATGAEKPDYDDGRWGTKWDCLQGKRWDTAWLRGRIPPSPLLAGEVVGTLVIGGYLTVWIDGQRVTEGYRPEFPLPTHLVRDRGIVIAVRSQDGEIASEMLKLVLFRSERVRQIKALRRSLDFVLQWRKAQPGHAEAIDAVLARYLQAADPETYERDPEQYLRDLMTANEILRELDPVAKRYTVHVVPHSHVDLAWGWDFAETRRIARSVFSEALRLMEEHPDYTFSQDQPPMYGHLEGSAMERSIRERIKEGRWDIPGSTFSEPESFMPGGESFVRHFLTSKRYFRDRFGKLATIHWAPDNFSGHTNTLPQIMKLCGITAFAFGNWYQADHGGQFWWEGLDGTRIFAHYMTSHYDSAQMIEQDKVIRNVCDHMRATSIDRCMLLDGDDLTPPWPGSPMGLEKLRALAAFPTIEFSTPHRFFGGLKPEAMNLRVVKGEFISTTGPRHNNVGAYTTFAEVKRRNRSCEWALRTLEAFSALALRERAAYPQEAVNRAWRLALFNQMHDIFPGTAVFAAYDEAYKRYDEVESICAAGTNAAANVLASNIDTRGEGIPLVLFNPLSWDRIDPAEVRLTLPQTYDAGFEVVDGDGGDVPCQVLDRDLGTFDKTNKNFRVLLLPDDVPAMGHRVVWMRPVAAEERRCPSMAGPDGLSLDNEHLRVRINPRTGALTEIFDKRVGRNVVPVGQEACALEGQTDAGNPWHLCPEGRPWRLNDTVRIEVTEDGDVRAAVRVTTTWHRSTFVQEFRLTRNGARLEVRTVIDCQDHDFVVRTLIPVDLPAEATWTCEVPYGAVERPIPDNDRAAQTWVDVSDGTWGVSVLNEGRYGHSRRADGTLTLTLLRSVRAHKSQDQTDAGRHELTYAVLSHAGDWRSGETIRQAHALNCPIVASRDIPHSGAKPHTASTIRIGPPNIVLGALKKAEDAEDWVLHLYEATGRQSDAVIVFDQAVAEARETDLIEWDTGAELAVHGRDVRRAFRPWEIAGIRVRLQP